MSHHNKKLHKSSMLDSNKSDIHTAIKNESVHAARARHIAQQRVKADTLRSHSVHQKDHIFGAATEDELNKQLADIRLAKSRAYHREHPPPAPPVDPPAAQPVAQHVDQPARQAQQAQQRDALLDDYTHQYIAQIDRESEKRQRERQQELERERAKDRERAEKAERDLSTERANTRFIRDNTMLGILPSVSRLSLYDTPLVDSSIGILPVRTTYKSPYITSYKPPTIVELPINKYNRSLSDIEYVQILSSATSSLPRYVIGTTREKYEELFGKVLSSGYLNGDTSSELRDKIAKMIYIIDNNADTPMETIARQFLKPNKIMPRSKPRSKRSVKKKSVKKKTVKKKSVKKRSAKKRSAKKK